MWSERSSIKLINSQTSESRTCKQFMLTSRLRHPIMFFNRRFNESVDNTIFELPDKRKIELSKEIYSIPEMIFRPIPEMNYEGIPDLIKSSLERVEYEARRELLSNIYVVGGNSLLVNYIERLQKEMYEKELWGFSNKAKVFTATGNNEKQHCNWLGGSIMGSMATFPQFMMTKNDYEEHGAILIERRCLSQVSYQKFLYCFATFFYRMR
eukprot:TRINITY_DN2318_c0_g1_i2.p2 TRINITY_DN2318_c0_g1~~TRINITY_DN2318_c0_g1_i2.p2  ORF type:complete len:210 (+),score=30.70 TRINITY_DN2318_c0_g1_i2:699-1328(+)